MKALRVLPALALAGVAVLGCGRSRPEAPVPEAAPSPAPTATVPAPPPPAPVALPEAAEFARLETAWSAALQRRDKAALERLVGEGFLITGVGSTAADPVGTREEWLLNAEKYPWPLHEVRDLRLAAVSADTVVVKCVWSGDYPPESLTLTGGRLDLLVTDVWTRRGGDWVVVARHTSLPFAE